MKQAYFDLEIQITWCFTEVSSLGVDMIAFSVS